MQATVCRRFATPLAGSATSGGSSPLVRSQPMNLLPPIPLYRRILRTHRYRLGPDERVLGDQYIKSEFRAHRNVENPVHIIGFLTEWQMYAQLLEGDDWKGATMDKTKIDKMSDQQIGQMYELMQAIQKAQSDEDDGSEKP